jgi:hypothetical protein
MIRLDWRYKWICEKLHAFRNHEKRIRISEGALFVSMIGICAALLLLTIESLFWLSPLWKWLLLLFFGSIILFALIRTVCSRLFSYWFLPNRPSDDAIAERIGSAFPEIKDRLVNAIQVFRRKQTDKARSSPILAEAALERMFFEAKSLDFNSAVSSRILRQSFRLFISMLLTALFASFMFCSSFLSAWNRWRHPNQVFEKPIPYNLEFKPGSIQVVQGDSVQFSVESKGPMPREIDLLVKDGRKEVKKIVLQRPYRHQIASIQNSMTYHYAFESYRSKSFSIDVIKRPELEYLNVIVYPPSYTRKPQKIYERNTGHIEAIKTSRVDLSIQASQENEKAGLVFQSGRRIELTTNGKKASGHFTIEKDDDYWIELQSRSGIFNDNPIRYNIRVLDDLFPSAKILSPEASMELDQSLKVPLVLEGEDDYGIGKARIGYTVPSVSRDAMPVTDTLTIDLPIPAPPPVSYRMFHLWNVDSLKLFPEDIVYYFFELEDNDALNGPKRGRSSMHSIRFPSIMEIVQKFESEQNQQINTLDTLFREDQAFLKNLERFSDELKTGQPVPWERKKEMQNNLENQRNDQKEIQDLSERLDAALEQIREDDWILQETLEKYSMLQELIQELTSPEINDSMKKLQDALNQTDPEILKKAMDAVKVTQEDVLKALDRSIALFKRLLAEQKIEEQIARMREMARTQKEINSMIQDDFKSNRVRASGQEEKIIQASEAFKNDTQKLSETLTELAAFPNSAFRVFQDAFEDERLSERLALLSECIDAGQQAESVRNGEMAVQSMERLQKLLENIRTQFQSRQKDRVLTTLKKTSQRLLDLSKQQETLMQEVMENQIANTQAVGEQNALIMGLQQTADSLYTLSRETFSVPTGIGNAIGEAKGNMEQSLGELEAGKRPGAVLSQTRSMGALNRSLLETQNAMGKMMDGGSGLGLDGFFAQMEQLGQEQMALNEKLMRMLENAGLSMEVRAGMPRLGSEQQSIRQRLERLFEQSQFRSKLPGDPGGMTEEMEKVAQELLQQRADAGTLQRQERILSRMLDFQRAMHEQDEGPERRAKTGKDEIRKYPPLLIENKSADNGRLKQRLLDLSVDGYTSEYRQWIQRYFERLEKEKL